MINGITNSQSRLEGHCEVASWVRNEEEHCVSHRVKDVSEVENEVVNHIAGVLRLVVTHKPLNHFFDSIATTLGNVVHVVNHV